jgi:hypothetical protein
MKIQQLHLCPQNQLPLKKHLLLAHLLRYEARKYSVSLTISIYPFELTFHLILEASLAFLNHSNKSKNSPREFTLSAKPFRQT